MKAIFIIGTDTGVGKTIVTGLLGRYLLGKNCSVITQKWIHTGSRKYLEDIEVHLKLMKREKENNIRRYMPQMAPYAFKFAASPHLAAGLEKKIIYEDKIKQSFRLLSREFDFIIVEGIGGALVPFNRKNLVIDIAKELGLPVLIVAGNKLGAINHTLLTVEAVRKRRMKIIGIIFNSQRAKKNDSRPSARGRDKIILQDNPKIIKILTRETILGSLPWLKNENRLYEAFVPVGNKILARLKRKW